MSSSRSNNPFCARDGCINSAAPRGASGHRQIEWMGRCSIDDEILARGEFGHLGALGIDMRRRDRQTAQRHWICLSRRRGDTVAMRKCAPNHRLADMAGGTQNQQTPRSRHV